MHDNAVNRIADNFFARSRIFAVRFFLTNGKYTCFWFCALLYVFSRVFRKYNLLNAPSKGNKTSPDIKSGYKIGVRFIFAEKNKNFFVAAIKTIFFAVAGCGCLDRP